MTIDLEQNSLKMVKDILQKNLDSNVKVYVFGSRVTGKAGKYSDLDIAIDAGCPLSIRSLSSLRGDFEYSDLDIRVDIVDLNGISDAFKNVIGQTLIPLAFQGNAD
jgi:predicted nucleotidyltransferase